MSVPQSSQPRGHRALTRFPVEIQSAYERFAATGEASAADEVLLAVVREHLPSDRRTQGHLELPDRARLVEDLGFDSLGIAEVIFFLEDLYRVRVPQEQLLQLRTVGDLRDYVRKQLPVRTA